MGRYIVRFREQTQPADELRNLRKDAQIRFSQVERPLAANDELRQQYVAFMQEYLSLDRKKLTLATTTYLIMPYVRKKPRLKTQRITNGFYGKITERSLVNRIHFAEKYCSHFDDMAVLQVYGCYRHREDVSKNQYPRERYSQRSLLV